MAKIKEGMRVQSRDASTITVKLSASWTGLVRSQRSLKKRSSRPTVAGGTLLRPDLKRELISIRIPVPRLLPAERIENLARLLKILLDLAKDVERCPLLWIPAFSAPLVSGLARRLELESALSPKVVTRFPGLGSLAGDGALLGACVAVGGTGVSPGLKNSGPFSTVSLGSNSTGPWFAFGAVSHSLAAPGRRSFKLCRLDPFSA